MVEWGGPKNFEGGVVKVRKKQEDEGKNFEISNVILMRLKLSNLLHGVVVISSDHHII